MKYLFPYIFERYLARQIYAAFGFILFALVALFLFFDILSELGSVKGQYTLPLALLHVLLKAPSRISEIIPIAGLIGSIYVFAMLASQSEFTILRIAGLDIRRGLTTLAKISLPLIIVTLVMSEWLGPYTENLSDQIRMKALGSSYSSQFKTGVWVKDRLRDEDGSGPIRPGVRYVNVGKIEQDNEIKNIRMPGLDIHCKRTFSFSATLIHVARCIVENTQHWNNSIRCSVSPFDVRSSCTNVVNSKSNSASRL